MSSVDLDDVVMRDSEVEFPDEKEDQKPALGSSEATAVVLSNLGGTFIPMKRFDGSGLAEVRRCDNLGVLTAAYFDPSDVLVAAGLDKFVQLISTWEHGSEIDCIESFVMSYNPPARKSLVRGISVPVTSASISEYLHLPASGLTLSQVKCDEEYAVEDCYSNPDPYSITESNSDDVLLIHVRPQWRSWVQLVQNYLQLEPNATSVDRATLRAAVAIRRGVRINWALPLARSIHKCLVDFKSSAGDLSCASYIFTLVEVLCPKSVVTIVEPKKDPEKMKEPECSSSSKVSELQPSATNLLLHEFQTWLAAREAGTGDGEIQRLQTANVDLKTQVENYRTQLEKHSQRMQKAELEVCTLRENQASNSAWIAELEESSRVKERDVDACRSIIKNLHKDSDAAQLQMRRLEEEAATAIRNLRIAEDKVVHLEKSLFMEKANHENLQEWKQNLDPELIALRKFYSDFAYMRDRVDDALVTAFAFDKEYFEAGFVRSQPQSVSFASLDELENLLPVTRSVEEAYLWERQIFFMQTGLVHKEYVNSLRFEFLWNKACLIGSENLFTEVLARGDVYLETPAAAYFLVGDYGARVLRYYASLETRLANREKSSLQRASTHRKVEGEWLILGLQEALSTWDTISADNGISPFTEWQQRLAPLQKELDLDSRMHYLIKHCQERTTAGHAVDVHPAAYLRSYQATKARLQAKLIAKSVSELPQVDLDAELVFKKPIIGETLEPLAGTSENLCSWMLRPVPSSVEALDNHYLGKWPHLFSSTCAEPFPTWEAITWIVKDHVHIDRNPVTPLGVLQRRNWQRRTVIPPISVRSNPNYCACPRRYSWAPNAKWDSVFYNWPVIPGDFDTFQACSDNYHRFSEEHRFHKDPVCFRASIFAEVLAFWCKDVRIAVDYRVGARFSGDMAVYNSVMFQSTRRIRMLELMCQTQFLRDAHDNMIGDAHEEIGTRRGPSFNYVDKCDYFEEKRRLKSADLKAEEAVHVNAYTAEMGRL